MALFEAARFESESKAKMRIVEALRQVAFDIENGIVVPKAMMFEPTSERGWGSLTVEWKRGE